MKQKNLSEIRETLLANNSSDNKEKNITKDLHQKGLIWNIEKASNNNDELTMKKKIPNLSNKLKGNSINSLNLSNKKAKVKTNLKLLFKQHNNYTNNNYISNSYKKNNLILLENNEYKNVNPFNANNNFFNKAIDLSLRSKNNNHEAKLFSFSEKNKNYIKNIYPIKKNSEEKKLKIILKSGNKNTNYRKYLFKEKIGINNMKNIKDVNENKDDVKKAIKAHDMKQKGLFYLYNLQNNIYNNNKKIKNLNYPPFNTFNKTLNNNFNITQISKRDKSHDINKPIVVFPKTDKNSVNKKNNYNTSDKKNNFNLNEVFLNKTNGINNEEDIFHIKMKFRKQNNKNKYLNIFTQNDSDHNSMKKIKNINLLTAKNLENAPKKLKLKLIKTSGNNKTETLLNNNDIEMKKYSTLLINRDITNKNNDEFENNIINEYTDNIKINRLNNNNNKNNNSKINNISNNSSNNISEISKISLSIKDSKYYMNESLSLIKYIKDYYSKNKTYPETKINFYLYGRRIGQGAFGKVNLGLNVLTGRVVAIKSFKKASTQKFKYRMKKIQYETELMKRFNHKNITKILEVFDDEEYMLIIMEYINGGNLFSFVKKRRRLSEKMAKFLFKQIILGIQHIHSKNVVHRDIKLENILIDFNNNVKICDFGIGKVLKSENELLHDKCGTPMYMAPEIILATEENGYKGFPVDIWSSGITLYIMLSGNLPFSLKKKNKKENISLNSMKNNNNSFLENQIINLNPKKIDNISDEAKNLLHGILNKDPSKRLTCSQILNHPWLKNSTNIDFFNTKNNLINLFTKAEMTIMSKTYIDYRKGDIEDLKENFTISNLRNDEIKLEEKNITTKSTILDPFNSCVNDNLTSLDDSRGSKDDSFDDFKNAEIKLENDIMIFNNKVKEFNLNFEINNNQEVDNGMIIKTHSDLSVSSRIDDSLILKGNNGNKNKENIDYKNDSNDDLIILEEMERFGYDINYVLNCVENNVLCHASTVFYLLKNYRNIG